MRADYRCPVCGEIREDVHFFASVGAVKSAPLCVPCSGEGCAVYMEVIPFARFDLATDGEGGKAGQKFTIHRQVPTADGLRQVEEVVDSAHARRRIERDSEQRYRDGEGEPLRFRADHQSPSNMDCNSFGTAGTIGARTYDSGQPPQKKSNVTLTRHGERKPRRALGPGLSGRSALKG